MSKPGYILIAEDDEDDRFLMKLAFNEASGNARIEFVQNGIELLKHFNRFETGELHDLPSLVIVDLNMPKKNGRDALKELYAREYFNGIPVVVFSTTGNEMERDRCRELGIENYFVKPSNYKQLVTLAGRFAGMAGFSALSGSDVS